MVPAPPGTKGILGEVIDTKWLDTRAAAALLGLPQWRSVLYQRVRLFEALALAHGDGRYARLMKTYARVELLILDG